MNCTALAVNLQLDLKFDRDYILFYKCLLTLGAIIEVERFHCLGPQRMNMVIRKKKNAETQSKLLYSQNRKKKKRL